MCFFGAWGMPFSTTASIVALTEIAVSPLKMLSQCVRATLAPCNCKLLQRLLSWGGIPIGSLLGLLIAKCEQPQASGCLSGPLYPVLST